MERLPNAKGLLSKGASAHEQLKLLAMRGLLRPGRRLTPTDIAREFDTSSTPVRDALVRLAAEGLIVAVPKHGYYTKVPSSEEQMDLNELLLLNHACCLPVERPPVAAALQAGLAGLDQLGDLQGSDVAETSASGVEAVLLDLAVATGNAALREGVQGVLDRTHHMRRVDCGSVEGRMAQISGLRLVLRNLLEDQRTSAFAAARRTLDKFSARLPGLLERARAEALQLKFP